MTLAPQSTGYSEPPTKSQRHLPSVSLSFGDSMDAEDDTRRGGVVLDSRSAKGPGLGGLGLGSNREFGSRSDEGALGPAAFGAKSATGRPAFGVGGAGGAGGTLSSIFDSNSLQGPFSRTEAPTAQRVTQPNGGMLSSGTGPGIGHGVQVGVRCDLGTDDDEDDGEPILAVGGGRKITTGRL